MNRYTNYHRNTYLGEDEKRPAGRPTQPAAGGRGPRKPAKKRGLPIAYIIAIDVVIAALALFLFSLFYFILPKDMSGNTVTLPTPPRTETSQASPSEQSSPGETQSETATPQTSAVADNSDFGARFSDKFTTGDVEQTENGYKSANVNVTIEKKTQNDVTYYVADIYIRNLECFRTAFGQGTFGYSDPTDVVAQQNGAIVAINGDNCVDNHGPVVRNGEMQRDETFTSDVLVLGWDGVMTTYSPEEFDLDKVKAEGAWQIWTFGPMLLKDGQPMTEFNSSVNKKNPRTAVGYFEPGHYCFVVIDGRQEGYSVGMTTAEMSQLFADMGCTAAYNLDGGQTSEMAFMGAMANQPYNGGRSTSDILYIADIAGE